MVEAAILATRTDFLPLDDIAAEYRKLGTIVEKTGAAAEREAFALLQCHIEQVRQRAGDVSPPREDK